MGKWCVGALVVLYVISGSGGDWLSCAQVTGCLCKWSSGKKTATCVTAGLDSIPRLASDIQVLDLNGNSLNKLEKDAFANAGLLNLQRLNLSASNLRSVDADAFKELRILIELDLSQNEIQHLSPDTFRGNNRLRLLVLNDNPLKRLMEEQFPSLQHLKRLELARCRLDKIHPTAFVHLKAIETIHVHQNLLTYLHQDTFNLPVLKTLTLSENPWNCDCRLKEFHAWFMTSNLGNEDVTCRRPENKAKVSWRVLKETDMVCSPEAVSRPTIIRTESGADISFGCFSRGDPQPKATWFYRNVEVQNEAYKSSEIIVNHFRGHDIDEYNEDVINKSSQWLNITILNVTSDLAGQWMCKAKNTAGEAKAFLTLVMPKARIATARVAPDYSAFFAVGGSVLALTAVGFLAACFCWKTKRRRVPPSRSFTDQEKKLLDTSLAASGDRTSGDLGSSYGFEMLDRSISLDSEDTHRCLDPVQITIEPHGSFPPPPAEFSLPAPYGNIFISVQVGRQFPDLLNSGATLPRRSKTCFLKSDYDNMGPRVTADGSSVWSLPGSNADNNVNVLPPPPDSLLMSTYSTEFTAL